MLIRWPPGVGEETETVCWLMLAGRQAFQTRPRFIINVLVKLIITT